MNDRYQVLASGTLQLAEQWRASCLLRLRFVNVTSGDKVISGTCQSIDDDGALIIHNDAGVHKLLSGVVQWDN